MERSVAADEAFLTIADVRKHFAPQLTLGDRIAARLGARVETRALKAVDGVSLSIRRGETLGLVGESGCGKSTLGRMIAGIMTPTSGTVTLDGAPVMRDGRKAGTRIQTVFQDPFASLDPRMRVGDIIAEGPLAHGLVKARDKNAAVAAALTQAGLDPALASRFPHQFSGGQRQRIAIARALAMRPDVLVCDEPVASLDVSIQAQIINLFLELRRSLQLTIIFISHDLSVVRHLSDRVAIMYLGRIVEEGPVRAVYDAPKHPYTQGLLDSVPKLVLDSDALVELKAIEGEIPSPMSPPPGCNFNPRCPIRVGRCLTEDPALRPMGPDRSAACHLATP
ncbi:oligopeptide/dipeptide ABC transporter ATP-binding protein [Acuticoccus kandeliae]|uniref:ABC transporter ATP-binding protein n=1 Tax=Acuticoccus kandeliae TaxID=2073160 RepID=UPI000D3E513D